MVEARLLIRIDGSAQPFLGKSQACYDPRGYFIPVRATMRIPTVHSIRQSLVDIKDALIDQPLTTLVDLGDVPHVPLHQPMENPDVGHFEGRAFSPIDENSRAQ